MHMSGSWSNSRLHHLTVNTYEMPQLLDSYILGNHPLSSLHGSIQLDLSVALELGHGANSPDVYRDNRVVGIQGLTTGSDRCYN